ncbi:hypothetical protein COU13_01945 [Candidatus Kaiserbacteria bacterium CG10_big_fil_rev_8_21_14_0_10_43_70]|uniref:PilN domain-containing protein n=1 Tax=Candidatus Kaiserbacteria bacterium CG10_big_fil_rev_8_21_14_0_10_43_70 TaxID=1974605 RepID=A0A2H0UIQ0_9BACT|nr:MAG: hypothetical protein COU13_01945 [Candidatus Kaiserbacteria bacterium CG10_big_fil_rev_8_21_14_0_10_43_70]
MDSKITSSFIPTDTVRGGPDRPSYKSGGFDLLMLGGIILFIASVALAIGVFLYMQFVQASLSAKTEQLQRAQEAFEPALIAELTRLDDRMSAAESVLQQHIAPSELFRILEDLTLETISLTSLNFQANSGSSMEMTLAGVARSVNSIALQADLYGKHVAITSPIFSNINRDERGVLFDVSATLNPSALRYVNILSSRAKPAALPQVQPAQEETNIPFFAP